CRLRENGGCRHRFICQLVKRFSGSNDGSQRNFGRTAPALFKRTARSDGNEHDPFNWRNESKGKTGSLVTNSDGIGGRGGGDSCADPGGCDLSILRPGHHRRTASVWSPTAQ